MADRYGVGQIHAVGAGLCAACASVFAKLAVTSDVVLEMCHKTMLHLMTAIDKRSTFASESTSHHSSVQWDASNALCIPVAMCLRVFCFSLVFVFNTIMWTMFVKSLQRCPSVIATITNTSSNFFFTALSGWVLFGENLSLAWWCGAAFIVVGLLLINVDSRSLVTPVKQD